MRWWYCQLKLAERDVSGRKCYLRVTSSLKILRLTEKTKVADLIAHSLLIHRALEERRLDSSETT